MNIFELLVQTLLPLLCAAWSFVYGVRLFFRRGEAMYCQLAVCAMGCIVLNKLFSAVYAVAVGTQPAGFHVGYFGVIAAFMFLFSANYGQMDGLVDSREKSLRPYRLLALTAPAVICAAGAVIFFAPCPAAWRIMSEITLVPAALASYYAAKHAIMPDVDMGILDTIRGYQAAVLLMCAAYAAELVFAAWDVSAGKTAAAAAESGICIAFIPVLYRGVRQWEL